MLRGKPFFYFLQEPTVPSIANYNIDTFAALQVRQDVLVRLYFKHLPGKHSMTLCNLCDETKPDMN
jgi:hypothetical protein